MKEPHRIKNGMSEWNRVPNGYIQLGPFAKVQQGDVGRISDEWYCEYPPKGMLIGHYVGTGIWYRKQPIHSQNQSQASIL